MEVTEVSESYRFEMREKYLPLKWKITHLILYLTCSLIGFVGSSLARILEHSLDQECLFYANISAIKDEEQGKWFVLPNLSAWNKQHCYGMMFIFTISFVYGLIWTVYFFTCSISQYRYKVKNLESFHGYGPPQRLVLPALVFNIIMTFLSGPIAVDTWKGLSVFCNNLMKITNSYTCLEAAELIYFKENNNNLESAKVMAGFIRLFGIALFIAWLLNTLLMLFRVFFWPDYTLMKEMKIEFVLLDKPGKDMHAVYKDRLRVWMRFLREKGLTTAVLKTINEIEFTFPSFIEEEPELAGCDANAYAEDAFNIAFTVSSTTVTGTDITEPIDDIDTGDQESLFSSDTLQLSKPMKFVHDEAELETFSARISQDRLDVQLSPNSQTDNDNKDEIQGIKQSFDVLRTSDEPEPEKFSDRVSQESDRLDVKLSPNSQTDNDNKDELQGIKQSFDVLRTSDEPEKFSDRVSQESDRLDIQLSPNAQTNNDKKDEIQDHKQSFDVLRTSDEPESKTFSDRISQELDGLDVHQSSFNAQTNQDNENEIQEFKQNLDVSKTSDDGSRTDNEFEKERDPDADSDNRE